MISSSAGSKKECHPIFGGEYGIDPPAAERDQGLASARRFFDWFLAG
jgi:hypothetical protein